MNFNLKLLTDKDIPILQNLAEYYLYDLNEVMPGGKFFNFAPDGKLHFPNLEKYWQEEGAFAYLVYSGNTPVGFCLVHRQPFFKPPMAGYVVGEFFIAKMYRRRGVGLKVAAKVMRQHPGFWEMRVVPDNVQAYKFWTQVGKHVAPDHHEIREKYDHLWHGYVFCIDSRTLLS